MKRFAVAVLSVLLVWTVTRLVAQDPLETNSDPFPSLEDPAPANVPVDEPGESPQRERFLEIMRAKAALMDEAELEAAIQQADLEMQDLQARRMLTNARETLLQLVETYPETPSADAARRMLGREAGPVPYYQAEQPSFTSPLRPEPIDDHPDFEEPGFSPLPGE